MVIIRQNLDQLTHSFNALKSQTVIKYLVGMSTWITFKSIFVQKER